MNSSISSVLPVLHGLLDNIQISPEEGEECVAAITNFKEEVASEIQKRWNIGSADLSNLLPLSTAVDPRFKNMKCLSEEDIETIKGELLKKMDECDCTGKTKDDSFGYSFRSRRDPNNRNYQ